jgi:acyl-coenzyme A synthetase/AMP-(fatty) acid ligase
VIEQTLAAHVLSPTTTPEPLLRLAARDPANLGSVLVDARQSLGFGLMADEIDRRGLLLARADIHRGVCVVAELANDVPSALLAMTLLDHGIDFMPLPAAGLGARALGEVELPGFCEWIVSPTLDVRPNPNFRTPLRPEVEARLFMRTSGSLSTPKLVVRMQRHVIGDATRSGAAFGLAPRHRIALTTPIYHSFGLGSGLVGGVLRGASIDLQPRPNVLGFLEREAQFEPNVSFLTPTFCRMLVRARRRPRPYDFLVSGGDCLDAELRAQVARLHGPVLNGYGSTEMGFLFLSRGADGAECRSDSIGLPMEDVQWRIVDSELQIRSARAFSHYVNLSGETLPQDGRNLEGWYCTGDLAAIGARGELRVLGRVGLSCNRNGVLVPFADIETRLRRVQDVGEAIVVAGAEGLRGRELIAFCVATPGTRLTGEAVRSTFAGLAPAYAVPDRVVVIDRLPLLANGKVDRRSLQADPRVAASVAS